MVIEIIKNKTIADLQDDFNQLYPFLRLEFYRNVNGRLGSFLKQKLNKTVLMYNAGNQKEGKLEIADFTTVEQLEKIFQNRFGMSVQVSRKSGSVWLETTMTDNWTLKQQNEHGRELSSPAKNTSSDVEIDSD